MSDEFELYHVDIREMDLFNEVDQEKIQIEGAPFTIWLFDLEETRKKDDSFPEDGLDLNQLYGEALPETMVYHGPHGPLKGSYLEPTWTQDLMAFGITEPEEINIKFNKVQVVELLGRPFIIGDVIKSFHQKHYIIEDTYVSEETPIWQYIHLNVIARKVDPSQMILDTEARGVFSYLASGVGTFGGSAITVKTDALNSYSPSGGMAISGEAGITITSISNYIYSVVGAKAITSGTSDTEYSSNYEIEANGSIILSGSIDMQIYEPSGGIVLGGHGGHRLVL